MTKIEMLTREEILHLSTLANLTLTETEVEKYQKILSETIKYVENMQELDTSHVGSTSQIVSKPNTYFEDGTKNTRKLTPEEATQNSKSKKGNFFVIKRIMHG